MDGGQCKNPRGCQGRGGKEAARGRHSPVNGAAPAPARFQRPSQRSRRSLRESWRQPRRRARRPGIRDGASPIAGLSPSRRRKDSARKSSRTNTLRGTAEGATSSTSARPPGETGRSLARRTRGRPAGVGTARITVLSRSRNAYSRSAWYGSRPRSGHRPESRARNRPRSLPLPPLILPTRCRYSGQWGSWRRSPSTPTAASNLGRASPGWPPEKPNVAVRWQQSARCGGLSLT